MRRLTLDEVKERLSDISPDIELLSKKYVSAKAKTKCRCRIDKYEWETTWSSLNSGHGCPKCAGNIKYAIKDIKSMMEDINPDILILSDKYIDNLEKLKCKCLVDGNEWSTNWNKLSQGRGCPVCGRAKIGESRRLSIKEIKFRCGEINPNMEILSDVYINADSKLKCKC